MTSAEKEVDRVLTLLRNKIREQNFTQLEVQQALGWGRSYISQLLTQQKSLRVEQVLLILGVIGIDAAKFFAELYNFPGSGFGGESAQKVAAASAATNAALTALRQELEEQRELVRSLLRLLVDKQVVTLEELSGSTLAMTSLD